MVRGVRVVVVAEQEERTALPVIPAIMEIAEEIYPLVVAAIVAEEVIMGAAATVEEVASLAMSQCYPKL